MAAFTINHTELADMNGPLGYWGPITSPSATRRVTEVTLTPADASVLARLGETLNGRTWSGTNVLMSALFAAREPVAV